MVESIVCGAAVTIDDAEPVTEPVPEAEEADPEAAAVAKEIYEQLVAVTETFSHLRTVIPAAEHVLANACKAALALEPQRLVI